MDLSSKFYELIPEQNYQNQVPPVLQNDYQIKQKRQMIKDLWDLDTAGSTLIAALNQLWNFNPLDYCLHALEA